MTIYDADDIQINRYSNGAVCIFFPQARKHKLGIAADIGFSARIRNAGFVHRARQAMSEFGEALMADFKIDWIDREREPQNPPDPRYPHGIDLDLSEDAKRACSSKLPYPTPRCGYFYVECRTCSINVLVTTTGRADDPRSIKLACKFDAWAIETWVPDLGWCRSTRAGPTLQDAQRMLAGYDRAYPSEKHRLVERKRVDDGAQLQR